MKIGTEFNLSHIEMLEPLVGRLVKVPWDGETVHARITRIEDESVVLVVVSKDATS
jgi:hypothetical protein